MTNSQVVSHMAIGSFLWKIWGLNTLFFHLLEKVKTNPEKKNLSLNTVSGRSDLLHQKKSGTNSCSAAKTTASFGGQSCSKL